MCILTPVKKDDPTISTSLTERMNKALNQCELAGIILNCFPRRYEDQYITSILELFPVISLPYVTNLYKLRE